MSEEKKGQGPLRSMLSRRGLLKAAGASAVGAAVAGFHGGPLNPKDSQPIVVAQEDEDEFEWDDEFDVVVVGGGAAGSAAAVTANDHGASVAVLEKASTYGGTTGKSGGVYWVPNNSQMQAEGLDDPKEDALRYMARLAYPHLYHPNRDNLGLSENVYELLETFYDHAAEAIDYLQEQDALISVANMNFPDYYAELPENAAPYGREMQPLDPDGEPAAGAELIRQLRAAIDERDIPVFMEHRAERLIQNEDGRVIGLEASNADGETVAFAAASGVIFATGGFTHNVEMRNNFLRGPIFGGCTVPTGTGDVVTMAGAVGAALGNMQNAWWWQIVVEQSLQMDAVPTGIAQLPGDSMVQVNRFGHRVVNEKAVYNERTQAHFHWDTTRAEYTNLVLFMIYDQRTAEEYAGSFPIPSEPTGADYVVTGDTLEELAEAVQARLESIEEDTAGVELDEDFLDNFRGTLGQYNQFAENGNDRQFHRGETAIEEYFHGPELNDYPNPRMHPLSDEGPYYCIILGGGTLDTKGGPVTNGRGEILNTFGEPIPGIYGAGNCVASAAGQAYWAAGGTLGPALTFGYLSALSATEDVDPSDDDDIEDDEEEENDVDDEEEVEDEGEDDEPDEDDDDDDVAAEPQEHTVEIKDDLTFDPEHITIRAGDSITFVNVGAMVHSATGDPDKVIDSVNAQLPDGAEAWDSGMMDGGEEFTHTFDVPGEYTYACIPHEAAGQVGSITVED